MTPRRRPRWHWLVVAALAAPAAADPQGLAHAPRGPWAVEPLIPPVVPQPAVHADWPRGDADRFVLAKLLGDGQPPPPPADPRALARRLSFDLHGLPPAPEAVERFVGAVAAVGLDAAVAALVDDLLTSPHYGEHLARAWLDVVRYADSNGFDWDEFRPQAWRYRDYVVRAFNDDKPFDRFIREQLAGDELVAGPPRTPAEQDALLATGYLRLGPHDNAAGLFDEQDRSRAELLADLTETTATAFLGLTFACCRCHDHKHDPFPQTDHYRLRAFFAAVRFADDLPLDLAPEQELAAGHNRAVDEDLARFEAELALTAEADGPAREALSARIAALRADRRAMLHGLAMTDSRAAPPTHLLLQGDHRQPGETVEPGIPALFDAGPIAVAAPPNPRTTGRRLALAEWIVSPANPLTPRVTVNRIWLVLHGQALVATPDDFGTAGTPPDDRALLDHLAHRFVADGWSVKRLVRRIVTGAAYRQASRGDADHVGLRRPRRLSAEQVRDALLAVSGLLDDRRGGPPVWPPLPPEVLASNPAFLDDNAAKTKGWYPSPPEALGCRSLYLVQKRNTPVPLLATLDLPDNAVPCGRRTVSTTAPQALALLNGAMAADAARAIAARVAHEAGADPDSRLDRLFALALQRPPADEERAACRNLLARGALVEVCRALLNSAEFVYVD
jgi:hypothetical protein